MLATTGCSGGGTEARGSRHHAIVGGTEVDPSNPNSPQYPAVVTLKRNGLFDCTGTFITPHLILTAAHCFDGDSAGPNEAVWCDGSTTGVCQNYPANYVRDGWLAGVVTAGSYLVDDSVVVTSPDSGAPASQGQTYAVDYVWFAPPPPGETGHPDVAVVHSVEAYTGPLPTLMPRGSIISYATLAPYVGQPIVVVGTSDNDQTVARIKRYATTSLTGAGSVFRFDLADDVGRAGDSGGPIMLSIQEGGQTVEKIFGVFRTGNTGHYLTYAFLDELCKNGPFETCDWTHDASGQLDADQDGIPDATDNCPKVANADQANCDKEAETNNPTMAKLADRPTGVGVGDACDFDPCPQVAPGLGGTNLLTRSEVNPTSFPWLYWEHPGAEAIITVRPTGFPAQGLSGSNALGTRPRYCACHHPSTGLPSSDTVCRTTLCRSNGDNSNLNVYDDTGYQTAIWKHAPGDCPLNLLPGQTAPTDPDNNGRLNECLRPISDRTFRRVYGHLGTSLCTKRQEAGCTAGDNRAFWLQQGNSESFTWAWLAQDYPHIDSPTTHYDPSTTQTAKVRIWLHAEVYAQGYANSYSELVVAPPRLSVARPFLDSKIYRWWLALPAEPWGPLTVLTPIPREIEEVPDGWAWLEDADAAATRVLVASAFDAGGSTLGSEPSVFFGEPEQSFDTVGFAACRLDEATFTFGGENGRQELSTGLWMGYSQGGSYAWQPVAVGGLLAMSTATSTPSSASTKKTAKTLPPGKDFKSWVTALQQKVGKSRPALAVIAAQKKTAFDAAMTARAQARAAKLSTSTSAKGQPTLASTLVTRSFGGGSPLAQKHAVIVAHRDELSLVALFGETEENRGEGDPVPVAIYDLSSGEWLTGDVDWSCGPRTSVAHTATGYDGAEGRALIFYGGRLGGETVDGLFLKTLGAESLFDGSDVVRLDQAAVDSGLITPGARADAVLAYDPDNRVVYLFGGTDRRGRGKNDLWIFSRRDGTWTLLANGDVPNAPPAVLPGGLAISPVDGSVIVIAGVAAEGEQGSSWRWANGVWRAERLLGGN